MKWYSTRISIALLTILLIPVSAFSNGYTSPWLGGELSGPGVANGAGVYWNPAAIGAIKGNSIFFTLEPTYEYVSYQRYGVNQNGSPYNRVSFNDWAPLPTFAATFELPKNFGFGLGIYAPFARIANYPSNGPERFNGISETLAIVNVTPALTYKITPALIIGAGFSYVYGSLDVHESTTLDTVNPSDENPLYEAKVHLKNNTGSTYGWNAGIYYHPTHDFTVGLSYMARTYYTLEGNADITISPQMASLIGSSKFTAKSQLSFSMPQMVALGIHFEPTPSWIVDITEQWINWSIYKTIHIKLYDASNVLANREENMLTGFEDTLSSKIWTGYKGFKKWLIAAGATYDPSGIPLNHIYALNLEFNKIELFAEANYDITKSSTIGIGFDHNITQDANVTESVIQPSSNGLYKADIEKITLLYNYKF